MSERKNTSNDLLAVPVLGHFMLFLRGCQRIFWGLGTLMMDYMVLSGGWSIAPDSIVERTFFLVNLLVLGFLFGERALQNTAPLIESLIGKYKTKE